MLAKASHRTDTRQGDPSGGDRAVPGLVISFSGARPAAEAAVVEATWPRRLSAMIVRVAKGSTHNFAIRVSDWFLALMLTTFGLMLLTGPDIFATSRSFALLAHMAPACSWGTVCLVIGAMRLCALVINGTFPVFRWSPHIRFTMALLSCFVWFQIALGIALSPTISTALAVYPYLFLFDMYNTFLAASEAGVVERRYRNGGC